MTTSRSGSVTVFTVWFVDEDTLMQYVTLTLEAVGAGVQETLMEFEGIAWVDTCDGAVNPKESKTVCWIHVEQSVTF